MLTSRSVYKIWYVIVNLCTSVIRAFIEIIYVILTYNTCMVIFVTSFLKVVNDGHYLEYIMIMLF